METKTDTHSISIFQIYKPKHVHNILIKAHCLFYHEYNAYIDVLACSFACLFALYDYGVAAC